MCSFICRLIRLEFNSEGCGYYTELDAVELVGKLPSGTYISYIGKMYCPYFIYVPLKCKETRIFLFCVSIAIS